MILLLALLLIVVSLIVENDIVPLPSVTIACPLVPSDKFSSDIPTWLAAICVLVTEFPASSTAETEFTASFAFVTWSSPICIVSIEPVTNSLESTEFAAISAEPTAFAAIAAEDT